MPTGTKLQHLKESVGSGLNKALDAIEDANPDILQDVLKNINFNQKNSSELCCGVKNKEGVGMEGETTCPLPIQNSFLNPFDTTQLCCGELHFICPDLSLN